MSISFLLGLGFATVALIILVTQIAIIDLWRGYKRLQESFEHLNDDGSFFHDNVSAHSDVRWPIETRK